MARSVPSSTVAVPEAHRLEGMAQHPRVAVQPDLAIGRRRYGLRLAAHALSGTVRPARPSAPPWFGAAPVAVVACRKSSRGQTRLRDQGAPAAVRLQAAHRQHQKVGAVDKCVAHRRRALQCAAPDRSQSAGSLLAAGVVWLAADMALRLLSAGPVLSSSTMARYGSGPSSDPSSWKP